MIRFVGTNADGLPLKRSQSQRACENCRKKKKRCNHNSTASVGIRLPVQTSQLVVPTTNSLLSSASSPRPQSHDTGTISNIEIHTDLSTEARPGFPHHTASTSANRHAVSSTVLENGDDGNSHFVGDLNPEAVFLAATRPAAATSSADNNIGIWISRNAMNSAGNTSDNNSFPSSPIGFVAGTDPLMSKLVMSYLQDQCLRTIPEQSHYEALQRIYEQEVYAVLPIIDVEALALLPDNSVAKVIVKQLICLAAGTNPQSKEHLILPDRVASAAPMILSVKTFTEQLSYSVRTSIDLGLIKDRLVLIQALTTLSMLTQFSDDRHSSAELAARAVTHVQTVGLHLDTSVTRKDHVHDTRLFCCVWALDRLNAAFHGRPVLIHDRDIGRDMRVSINQQDGAFRLLLSIVLLLDRVIQLYRPFVCAISPACEPVFPTFEELLNDCNASRVLPHLLATIETLYHATAMLSSRSQSIKELSSASNSHLHQSLSAARITSIVGDEFKGMLSMLPIVPYAVSLSLRVSYRELRLAKSPYMRARARRQLMNSCGILRGLGDVFTTAILMVEMAEKIVKEMDKAHATINAQQYSSDSVAPSIDVVGSMNSEGGSRPRTSCYRLDATGSDDGEHVLRAPSQTGNLDNFPSYSYPMVPGDSSDFDIFEHFDPDFDLEAIDVALGDSINPAFPTSLIDFSH